MHMCKSAIIPKMAANAFVCMIKYLFGLLPIQSNINQSEFQNPIEKVKEKGEQRDKNQAKEVKP